MNCPMTELNILIEGCLKKSRHFQKKVYDIYSPLVYGVIKRYLPNKYYADEVLNDTFLKIC